MAQPTQAVGQVVHAKPLTFSAPPRGQLHRPSFAGAAVAPRSAATADHVEGVQPHQWATTLGSTSLVSIVAVLGAAVAHTVYRWYNTRRNPLDPMDVHVAHEERLAMLYTTSKKVDAGRQAVIMHDALFDRMSRLVRSNVTAVVKNLEDPEKIINQAVEDMEGDLMKIRKTYSEVLATEKRTQVQARRAEEAVAEWGRKAMLALEAGEEDLAREALKRKTAEQKSLDGHNAQLGTSTPISDNLLTSMRQLEARLDDARANKAQLIARAKTAETNKQVNDMLTGMDSGSAMAAFDRMNDKVEALESYAEVTEEISGGKVDDRFKQLEAGNSVDDELARMKKQLTGDTKQSLPPPS